MEEEDVEREFYTETYEGVRVGYDAPPIIKDPKNIAAFNIYKALEKYPGFTKQGRQQIQNEIVDLPDLQYMNPETLAAVLNYLRDYPEPKPKDFRDEVILEYFSRLWPEKSSTNKIEDKSSLIIRLKSTFLRYITALQAYRTNFEE